VYPADPPQQLAHLERGSRCTRRTTGAREEQKQRVAAELQQAAAAFVRHLEQIREGRVDDVGELLRADLAET